MSNRPMSHKTLQAIRIAVVALATLIFTPISHAGGQPDQTKHGPKLAATQRHKHHRRHLCKQISARHKNHRHRHHRHGAIVEKTHV